MVMVNLYSAPPRETRKPKHNYGMAFPRQGYPNDFHKQITPYHYLASNRSKLKCCITTVHAISQKWHDFQELISLLFPVQYMNAYSEDPFCNLAHSSDV